MKSEVRSLAWDSQFFGFKVGALNLISMTANGICRELAVSFADGFSLIYGFADARDAAACAVATSSGGRMVDGKVSYETTVPRGAAEAPLAPAGSDALSRRQLRALAWQAAEYSRFKTDPRMPAGVWRRMYTQWLNNSLSGEIADAVLVATDSLGVMGMVTVSHQGELGQIGLLAVAPRARGRGVGKHLIAGAVRLCAELGCLRLRVVTQHANLAACGLYEACGFVRVDHQTVFHFWSDIR